MIESVDQLPAALRPREFKVGDRVRVLPRPECFYCRESGEAEIGLTGKVTDISPPCRPEDEQNGRADRGCFAHKVWVEFEDASPGGCDLSHFAPTELEPIGDES